MSFLLLPVSRQPFSSQAREEAPVILILPTWSLRLGDSNAEFNAARRKLSLSVKKMPSGKEETEWVKCRGHSE